jgi:protein-serine/threonine kinase
VPHSSQPHHYHQQQNDHHHHHSSPGAGGAGGSGGAGAVDVYSHPAAVAYAAAHPRRTIPKFGPYLLLQTLGEGEFGKVKLGIHTSWGEEVAVKLIRKGNVDSTVRMTKVEREIEVLKVRKFPT